MKTKICSKCKIEKPIDDYYNTSQGYKHAECKPCFRARSKATTAKNKDKLIEYNREYYKKNKEAITIQKKKYALSKADYFRQWNKEYREKNKEVLAEKVRKRYNENIDVKIKHLVRSRLWYALKKGYKTKSAIELLGCDIEDFKKHLENQFQPGMTWDNHGLGKNKWNIDHIIPCAHFDLTKVEEQKKCFHYTNMRPLWQTENFAKRDKVGPREFTENHKNQIKEAGYDVEVDDTIFEQLIVE